MTPGKVEALSWGFVCIKLVDLPLKEHTETCSRARAQRWSMVWCPACALPAAVCNVIKTELRAGIEKFYSK
jgi:hypothetical protein